MVLDFRPKDQPKPWFARISIRAFSYAFLFVAVVVSLVARELRKPQPFSSLIEGGLYTNPEVEVIDTRVAPQPKKPVAATIEEDVVRIEPTDSEADGSEPEAGYFPGVKHELLNTIQDGSPHRPAEREAYYRFMKILKEHDAETFQSYLSTADEFSNVAFAQLFRQPNHYRGRLVRLKAKAHSCIENKFGKNQWGLEKYYHLYLESSEGHLMQANVLEIPEGFPISTVGKDRQYSKFNEDIELVGFFYKLIPYPARDDLRNSPLLFARTIQWTKPVAPPSETATWTTLTSVLLGGAILGITLAFFLSKQTPKTKQRKHGPPTAAELADLGRLGETHRADDSAPSTATPSASTTASGTTNEIPPTNALRPSNGPEAT